MVIKPAFAQSDDFGVLGELGQLIDGGGRSGGHFAGVKTHGGVNLGVGGGKSNGGTAGGEVSPNANEPSYTGREGPLNDLGAIGIKIRKIEVAVGIDEHKQLICEKGLGEGVFL